MKCLKYHLNKIFGVFFVVLNIIFIPNVKALVSPTSKFYVNDYANILSDETEDYIFNKSVALANADRTQIVVVTVPNLEGDTIENYAVQLYRNFQIGDPEKKNGLLLLLALEERIFKVEVGDGLEGILPDGKTGRFQDEYMIPYLKNDNWDAGIKNGYDAFYAEIVKLNNLNISYNNPNLVGDSYHEESGISSILLYLIFVSVIISAIAGSIIKGIKNKKKKWLYTLIYLIIWYVLYKIIPISYIMYMHLFIFIISRFFSNENYHSSNGGSWSSSGGFGGGSWSSSSHSSHSGFGGSSSGGGSVRRF